MFLDPFNLAPLLGMIIEWLFSLTKSYGLSLLIFTLFVKTLLFPFAAKNQQTMAVQSKLGSKQKEIREKYKNDTKKRNEELMKLNESESIGIFGGCVSQLFQLFILFAISSVVYFPLKNILHIEKEKIQNAIPIALAERGEDSNKKNAYGEMHVIEAFTENKEKFPMFDDEDAKKIEMLSANLDFFGTSLLKPPIKNPILWFIPIFTVLISFFSQYLSKKFGQIQVQTSEGCSKYALYFAPIFGAVLAFWFPAACGIYFLLSNVIELIQKFILEKFYSIYKINALKEAARIKKRFLEEQKIKQVK